MLGRLGKRRKPRFAQLVDRASEAARIRAELCGWVERVDASGRVESAGAGVIALLEGSELGWATPPARRPDSLGWLKPRELTGWIVGPQTMELRVRPEPLRIHVQNPPRVVDQPQAPYVLRISPDDPDDIEGFLDEVRTALPLAQGIIRPA